MNFCRTHRQIAGELFEGSTDRFQFPFCHCTVLSNISDLQWSIADWKTVFPLELCATRDTLVRWESVSNSDEIKKDLLRYFDPFWKFPPMDDEQILRLRTIIHPEILIRSPRSLTPDRELKVLDVQQERNARTLGDGHRIIYGIAGSGKTVLLIARAKLVSEENPDAKILVLCYNVTLREYLTECLKDYSNVQVKNFHQWAKLSFTKDEDESAFGERWLAKLTSKNIPEAGRYDTILIDEAQDFAPSWFRCVVAAMRDSVHGDLLIVHDSSQGLYGDKKICWKDVGIKAQGRTQRTNLAKNYRNTAEILRLATQFARTPSTNTDLTDSPTVVNVDPALCKRSFHPPMLLSFPTRTEELRSVREIIEKLIEGQFEPIPGYKVEPADIAVLYRVNPKHAEFDHLANAAGMTWLTRNTAERTKVCDNNTKLLTIHSAKGLQFRVVIVVCCNDMPAKFPDTDLATERSFLYVALTRAEELLILTHTGTSEFVRELLSSGQLVQCDLS